MITYIEKKNQVAIGTQEKIGPVCALLQD